MPHGLMITDDSGYAGGELCGGGSVWGDGSDGFLPGGPAGPHGHVLPTCRGGARGTHPLPPQVVGS